MPFGQNSLFDILRSSGPTPEQLAAEQQRQALLLAQQRQAAAAHAALLARPVPMSGPDAGGQGYYEPDSIFAARRALGQMASPVADFFNMQGPVINAFKGVQGDLRKAAGEAVAGPWSRANAATASKPKPQTQVQAFSPPQQGQGQQGQPAAPAAWNPFAGYTTVPGGQYGAPRDGGSRTHKGTDYSGMSVGTPIAAPPMGARLVSSGSDATSGNFGRWQLGNGGMISIAHLNAVPTAQQVGPGQPLAFLGNTGNASAHVSDPSHAVAHVRYWGADGKEVDPSTVFGKGSGAQVAQGSSPGPFGMPGMPAPPAVDEHGFNLMASTLKQIGQNLDKPYSATYTPMKLPDEPKPTEQVQADYSAGDEAFNKTAPINPFGTTPEEQAKNKIKMSRAGYFQGIAKALGNYQSGTGIGQLLANLGGAALAGRFAGDEKVHDELDKFDTNLASWNRALATRDDAKARDFQQVSNANIQSMNDYNYRAYDREYKKLDALNPSFDAQGNMITNHIQPDGNITRTVTPIDPNRRNDIMRLYAQNEINRSQAHTEADKAGYDANMAVFKATIPWAMQQAANKGDYGQVGQLARDAGTLAATAVVDRGSWQDLVKRQPNGEVAARQMDQDAWTAAGAPVNPKTGTWDLGIKPTPVQQQRHDAYLVDNLVTTFMSMGKMHELIGGDVTLANPRTHVRPTNEHWYQGPNPLVGQAVQGFRMDKTRQTTTQNAKGGTSISEVFNP